MDKFKTISAEALDANIFSAIGKEWTLITAEANGRVNAMTASWGGVGVIWKRNVAIIFVRKSRFTKTLIDASDSFSLSFLAHKEYAKELAYMGKASGRDEDKIAHSGLTVAHQNGVPYFEEAQLVLVCKKLCRQPIEADGFCLDGIDADFYADKDYHDMYIGEILTVLQK